MDSENNLNPVSPQMSARDKFDNYNTQKPALILKEYGRNIQKIVEYIVNIEEKGERTRYAHNLIELMRQINPNTRDSQDYQNKLWDDLYIMSRFSLEVESPYPMPEIDKLGKKPKRLDYNNHQIKYKHYGRNIELLIRKAVEIEDEEDKYNAIIHIGKLMKNFYISWNKDNIQDIALFDHIEKISGIPLDDSIKQRIIAETPLDPPQKERKNNKKNRKRKK